MNCPLPVGTCGKWSRTPLFSMIILLHSAKLFTTPNPLSFLTSACMNFLSPSLPYSWCIHMAHRYLSDLTFADGQPNYVRSSLVNLSKMRTIAQVYRQMKDTQCAPYCLKPVSVIQKFIHRLPFISEDQYLENRQMCLAADEDGDVLLGVCSCLASLDTLFTYVFPFYPTAQTLSKYQLVWTKTYQVEPVNKPRIYMLDR